MGYKFIDHTADIAVEIQAHSLAELFQFASAALIESLTNPHTVLAVEKKTIIFFADSYEEALVSFLSELNYFLTVKKWVFSHIENICMEQEDSKIKFSAIVKGENLSVDHELKLEIKAITYHQMEIKFKKEYYTTRIVFDI
ncbi:MAG: archease [bacterium]